MMQDLETAGTAIPETDENDPRVGQLLAPADADPDRLRVVLLGFPCDEGVGRNGGRRGAAEGPGAIREALYTMTPDAENPDAFIALLERTADVGNVAVGGPLEDDQQKLGHIVAGYLEQGIIPVIMGGGHETAYGHFRGYSTAELPAAILNVDAHTDVRPLLQGQAHSGSPFRQACEEAGGWCETYMAAGLQPHRVAPAHRRFIEDRGGFIYFRDETNITNISSLFHVHQSERLMVTFDMDAVDQAFAPGVSAPCTNGLPPDLWLTAAYLAGRNQQVTSFDLCELNPKLDRDGQTARLAALTIWHFLLGVSQR